MREGRRNFKEKDSEFKERVIQIRRVTKVVKGGKRMGFRAVVVVGDQKSKVGLGIGKAAEVSAAIRKGVEAAKRKMLVVPQYAGTIPHRIIGKFGASQVMMRPAPKGTGVIAGGAVRTILEFSGLRNIVAKSLGSNNAINVSRATLEGLSSLKEVEQENLVRGKELTIHYVETE